MQQAKGQLTENGRILIPAEMRRELGMRAGDQVVLSVCGKELRVMTLRERVAQAQQRIRRHFAPGTTMSDRLIQERREEEQHEQGGA